MKNEFSRVQKYFRSTIFHAPTAGQILKLFEVSFSFPDFTSNYGNFNTCCWKSLTYSNSACLTSPLPRKDNYANSIQKFFRHWNAEAQLDYNDRRYTKNLTLLAKLLLGLRAGVTMAAIISCCFWAFNSFQRKSLGNSSCTSRFACFAYIKRSSLTSFDPRWTFRARITNSLLGNPSECRGFIKWISCASFKSEPLRSSSERGRCFHLLPLACRRRSNTLKGRTLRVS